MGLPCFRVKSIQRILHSFLLPKPEIHYVKSNHVYCEYVKNNGYDALSTFLDFTDISSYLKFKLSAWRRVHFRKLLQSSVKESKNYKS